jgi:peptide/nickel transport system permease protein
MLIYTINRILHMIPVLFVLTVVVFLFMQMLPGDVIDTLIGDEEAEDPETRALLMKEYGLDQPIYVQYGVWIGKVFQGDFGKSLITRRPVSLELFESIPATVYLAIVGISLSILIAVPLGSIAAVKRNTPTDYAAQVTSLIGISIPEFWFAIMCVLLFSLYLGWLPSSGYMSPFEDFGQSIKYLILPAAAVGFRQAAYTTRLTRSSMLDEMNKEYVDTARSLGFSEKKVIYKYILRNAMIPTITISGLQLYLAIIDRDYPLIQAGILVLGIIVVVVNLLVDLLYRVLNPRVALN